MAVRYHVLVADDLMADEPDWAACGLRPAEQEPTDPEAHPGMHWWLFEDDGAAGLGLEGKLVELSFGARYTDDGGVLTKTPYITERRVIR